MNREQSIGASVSDTSADTAIEAVTVSANSRNRRPMMPPISSSGMKTAISDKLIESTVKPISLEPLSAAFIGVSPFSMWRWMFSTTTMASSTTKPTAMVSAINDRLSRLKLSRYIAANEPSSASGTVTPGMTVAQKLRRNSRMTSTTSTIVRPSVNSTSSSEARIVTVRSSSVVTSIAGGMFAVRRGSASLIRSTVSTTLAPGCLKTLSRTPRLLFW